MRERTSRREDRCFIYILLLLLQSLLFLLFCLFSPSEENLPARRHACLHRTVRTLEGTLVAARHLLNGPAAQHQPARQYHGGVIRRRLVPRRDVRARRFTPTTRKLFFSNVSGKKAGHIFLFFFFKRDPLSYFYQKGGAHFSLPSCSRREDGMSGGYTIQ